MAIFNRETITQAKHRSTYQVPKPRKTDVHLQPAFLSIELEARKYRATNGWRGSSCQYSVASTQIKTAYILACQAQTHHPCFLEGRTYCRLEVKHGRFEVVDGNSPEHILSAAVTLSIVFIARSLSFSARRPWFHVDSDPLPPAATPAPSCRSPGPLLRAFAAVASQDGDLIVLSQWQAAHVSLAPWERTAARQVCRLRSGGWVFLSLFQSFIFRLCFRLCPLSLTLSLCLSLLTLTLSRSVFSHTHSLSLICLLLSLLLSHPHSLSFFFPSFSASLFPSLFRSLCLSISLFPSHSLAIACSLLSFSLCSLF